LYNSGNKDSLALEPTTRSSSFSNLRRVSPKKKRQTSFEDGVRGNRKQVQIIDDDYDNAFTIKSCLESHNRQKAEGSESEFQSIHVIVYVAPFLALMEFKPYYYDLVLVDINMPSISGYELVEKIIKLDLNIKICFMTAGEINSEAIREIRHPSRSFGCFLKKNNLQ
jgi:CheY-like chemotaxis protein